MKNRKPAPRRKSIPDRWVLRRPIGLFIAIFCSTLAARAFFQSEPISWLNVGWATAFALTMTVVEEAMRKKRSA